MTTITGSKPLLTLAALLLLFTASAQGHSTYQSITTANGLPSNYVFAVCEDATGFLWAGTDKGLCRFDGFRWQVWDGDNGLPGNYVTRIFSDGQGGLWLNIDEHGLFHFANGRLRKLPLLASIWVASLQTTPQGELYVEGGLSDSKTGGGFLFTASAIHQPRLVSSIASTVASGVWANAQTKTLYRLANDESLIEPVANKAVSGWPTVWLRVPKRVLAGQTLYHVCDSAIVTNTHYYKLTPQRTIASQQPLFGGNTHYAFTLCSNSGLYVWDIKTGYWFIPHGGQPRFYNAAAGLGTDYVNDIHQTADGTLVISTLGAGLQVMQSRYRKTFRTGNSLVRSIVAEKDGWLLLAGEKLMATTTGNTLQTVGVAPASATSLYKNGKGLAVGSLQGLSFYSEESNGYRQQHFLEYNAGVSALLSAGDGFLAGSYGSGVIRFKQGGPAPVASNYPLRVVEQLSPLPRGYAALSYEKGVFVIDTVRNVRTHFSKASGLLSNSVHAAYHRADSLWVGTKGGINLCVQGKVVSTIAFPAQHGTEKAVCIFHDRRNRLWVVSDAALYLVEANSLRCLGSHPVVEGHDVVSAATYNPATGELGVGSTTAFSVIDVDAIRPYQPLTTPQLTTVLLDGLPQTDSVFTVPYQFHTLRFAVAPSASSLLLRSKFYYRLQGRDEAWMEVKDSLVVSLSALRPGSYVLWMKTINADGFETTPKAMARFAVQRPWWLRWPFLLCCFGATIAASVMVAKAVEQGRRKRREARLALQQSLQAERERISKDLHDHLGANLATIIAQTDNIEARLYKGDVVTAATTVQHLSTQSRETMNVLRETIWAVQEAEHSLEEFAIRIRSFLQRLFESTTITWEVKNETQQPIVLSPTQTLHLFRIVQEAAQNILKHAGATNARFCFEVKEVQLRLHISDNGRGFASTGVSKTNGLLNMKERAKLLGGSFAVMIADGTTLIISIPL